jgi:hypothetical protein
MSAGFPKPPTRRSRGVPASSGTTTRLGGPVATAGELPHVRGLVFRSRAGSVSASHIQPGWPMRFPRDITLRRVEIGRPMARRAAKAGCPPHPRMTPYPPSSWGWGWAAGKCVFKPTAVSLYLSAAVAQARRRWNGHLMPSQSSLISAANSASTAPRNQDFKRHGLPRFLMP